MKSSIFIAAAEDLSPGAAISDIAGIENIPEQNGSFRVKHLQIDQLRSGWNTPILCDHFRSGNGPLMAVEFACKELQLGNYDLVVIAGHDNLKTEYSPTERHQLMDIYSGLSLPEAYTKLSRLWCIHHQITDDVFKCIADKLFNNYLQIYAHNIGQDSKNIVDHRWFNFITDLFRGVDCANPVVDFNGRVVLATKSVMNQLCPDDNVRIEITGIANKSVHPGPDGIQEIAEFTHLSEAYHEACSAADIDFAQLFMQRKSILEVYTCFPIIPLAFLYSTGLATDTNSLIKIIDNYPLTITGGMNLAKAAWNMPVLRTMIALYHKLKSGDDVDYAGIHGNGGLGEKQGFMIMKRVVL